ncbi:hypothetical protein D3C86_1765860 [compost metagenome]
MTIGSSSTSRSMTLQLMHQSAYQSSSSGVPDDRASASARSSSAGVLRVCQVLAFCACPLLSTIRGWPIGLSGSVWPLKAPYQQASA